MIVRWFNHHFPAPSTRSRRKQALRRGFQPAWVETLENRIVLSSQNVLTAALPVLPGTIIDDVAVRFDLTQGRTSFAEMGLFEFDADGTVGGATPGSDGFEEAVLNSATRNILFAPGTPAGNSIDLTFFGGRQLGVYFRQNPGTLDMESRFTLQSTSANTLRIAFDETPPLWSAVSNVLGSDARRFDDALINVTVGDAVRFPAPILAPIANRTIPEVQPFQLVIAAQNPAGPQSDLRYQLDTAPQGMAIDPVTGLLSWTPTEAQGPGRYDVVVLAFNINRPQSFTTQRFTIDVAEVNSPPVINPIPTQQVVQGQALSFVISATDSDLPIFPGGGLTFSLVDNTIAAATIDPVTGRFRWTPTPADAPGPYSFTVRITDSGSPALSTTQTFIVQVNPLL